MPHVSLQILPRSCLDVAKCSTGGELADILGCSAMCRIGSLLVLNSLYRPTPASLRLGTRAKAECSRVDSVPGITLTRSGSCSPRRVDLVPNVVSVGDDCSYSERYGIDDPDFLTVPTSLCLFRIDHGG